MLFKMIDLQLWLKETSQPIIYRAHNTYTKGAFYCIHADDDLVYKYPIDTIFRVIESYRPAQDKVASCQ